MLISLELEDGSTEMGYIVKKEKEFLYFNFIDDLRKVTSIEIIKEDYIKRLKILEDIEVWSKEEKIIKIKMYTDEIYFGNIITKNKNYLILRERMEFNNDDIISVIKVEKIEEITEILEVNEIQKVELKELYKNVDFYSILNFSLKNQLLLFIDNEKYLETKVGIITELGKDKLKLKEFSQYRKFSEISTISYSEIQLLYVHNYKVI